MILRSVRSRRYSPSDSGWGDGEGEGELIDKDLGELIV